MHKQTIHPHTLSTIAYSIFQHSIHRFFLRLKMVVYSPITESSTTNTTTLYYY